MMPSRILLAGLTVLACALPCHSGQCRTAQITYEITADAEAGTIDVDRSPKPYGRGILCQRFIMANDSAPVIMRITMRPGSCDSSHPDFNLTVSGTALDGGGTVDLEDVAAEARRRVQNPDFPPGCGSGGGGARELPTDAYGGARDCQESCMWCSGSLWMGFAVHFEDPRGVAAPFCQPIHCNGEPEEAGAHNLSAAPVH
eukprot:COSAG05_NODE_440_length_9809_cov_10.743769_2_plen_200_part_00